MPLIYEKFKKGYDYENNRNHVSKMLENIVFNNFKQKQNKEIQQEMHIEAGGRKHIKAFNKKIKQKIKNNI
jgi:hypothetical protein